MTLGPTDLVLCSGTLPRPATFVERIDAAVAGGFSALSMWGRDYRGARREGHSDADLRALLADNGLVIAELDPAWWWTPITIDTESLAAIDDMEVFSNGEAELFAIADALGARSINAVDVLGGPWSFDDAAEALAGFCDRAAEHDLLVHLEFLPWSRISNLAAAWEIVRLADRPNAGVAVDAWHWFRGISNLETLESIPGNRISAVQLSDGPAVAEANLMTASLHDRCVPGAGEFGLVDLVRALQRAGAAAPIGVEVFSDPLHNLGPVEAARQAGDATRQVLAAAATHSATTGSEAPF